MMKIFDKKELGERLRTVFEHLDVSTRQAEKQIGAGNGTLSRAIKGDSDLSSKWISRIIYTFNVDPDWLFTGDGAMLRGASTAYKIDEGGPRVLHEDPVPLVSNEAAAGFGTNSATIRDQDILERYLVPDFHSVDFMLRVTGNSMSPTYQSGDIVACRAVTDRKFIQWGRVYLIASRSQGLLIKRLHPGKDDEHFECISDNGDFAPFQFPTDDLESIGLIVGTIRLE